MEDWSGEIRPGRSKPSPEGRGTKKRGCPPPLFNSLYRLKKTDLTFPRLLSRHQKPAREPRTVAGGGVSTLGCALEIELAFLSCSQGVYADGLLDAGKRQLATAPPPEVLGLPALNQDWKTSVHDSLEASYPGIL